MESPAIHAPDSGSFVILRQRSASSIDLKLVLSVFHGSGFEKLYGH
jgi:hypothetical protein